MGRGRGDLGGGGCGRAGWLLVNLIGRDLGEMDELNVRRGQCVYVCVCVCVCVEVGVGGGGGRKWGLRGQKAGGGGVK